MTFPAGEAMQLTTEFFQGIFTTRRDQNIDCTGDFLSFIDAFDKVGRDVSV